jgi:autotransporter-associated beta strand protein
MKRKHWLTTGVFTAALLLPAMADVFYSGIQNVSIPFDFTGVTLTIDGGKLNPVFGGAVVFNNDLLQPVRTTTAGDSALQNLGVGVIVDSSKTYAGGEDADLYGVSTTHLGTTFTSGQEGYIGFKVNGNEYGWARVVFSTGGSAVIKDWAYDTTDSINVGRIQQSEASLGAQTVTLSPGTGESFSLGSAITDTNSNVNSLVKNGVGKTILTGTNTYTGTTTINGGVLVVNGSLGSSSPVTIYSGGTLGGSGTVGGTVDVKAGGTLAPGNSPGVLTTGATTFESGSIFSWDIASTPDGVRGTAYDGLNTPSVSGSGGIFQIVLQGSEDFSTAFWNTNHSWSDIFKTADGSSNLSSWTSAFSSFQFVNSAGSVSPSGVGSFSFTGGNTLTWSAVPEPTSALAGLLITAGLLRRRRA